jgi:hypothetical protein
MQKLNELTDRSFVSDDAVTQSIAQADAFVARFAEIVVGQPADALTSLIARVDALMHSARDYEWKQPR